MEISRAMVGDRILYFPHNNSYRTLQEAKVIEVTEKGSVKLGHPNSTQWYRPQDIEGMELVEVIVSSEKAFDKRLYRDLCRKFGETLADKPLKPIEFEKEDPDYIRPNYICTNN